MKFNLFITNPIVILALIATFNPIKEVKAQSQLQFICGESFDKETQKTLPTTFALGKQGKVPIVLWNENFSSYSSAKRCQEVSLRFQQAYDNDEDKLEIITNGTMNNQPVICTATKAGGECHILLITLRKEDNPNKIMNELRKTLEAEQVGPIKHSSGVPQIYYQLDIDRFVRNAPVD